MSGPRAAEGGEGAPTGGTRRGHGRYVLMNKVQDIPSDVTAEAGEVMVDGPGGVCVSLTPGAAMKTSSRLMVGAMQARTQRADADRERKHPG